MLRLVTYEDVGIRGSRPVLVQKVPTHTDQEAAVEKRILVRGRGLRMASNCNAGASAPAGSPSPDRDVFLNDVQLPRPRRLGFVLPTTVDLEDIRGASKPNECFDRLDMYNPYFERPNASARRGSRQAGAGRSETSKDPTNASGKIRRLAAIYLSEPYGWPCTHLKGATALTLIGQDGDRL